MNSDAASTRTSLVLTMIVAVAVVTALLWPQEEAPQPEPQVEWFEALPAASAGIASERKAQPSEDTGISPQDWIAAAEQAESWLAAPETGEFKAMRDSLTEALIGSDRFDRYPNPVTIDLQAYDNRDTIKYLVESRPGIMSIIYYSEVANEPAMVVYWPEVTGDNLVYTPLGGTSAKALSDWVRNQVALAAGD